MRTQIAQRREFDTGVADDSLVFVMPVRGAKPSQGRWESAGVAEAMDRTTERYSPPMRTNGIRPALAAS